MQDQMGVCIDKWHVLFHFFNILIKVWIIVWLDYSYSYECNTVLALLLTSEEKFLRKYVLNTQQKFYNNIG